MKMVSRGYLKMAVKNVHATKGRSLLTMFGVTVGIAAVVTVVGIGEGVKTQVASQVGHFGNDLITVRPGQVATHHTAKSLLNDDLLLGATSIGGLNTQDLKAVQNTPGVRLAAPLGVLSGAVQSDENQSVNNDTIVATNASMPSALNQNMAYGDFFSEDDEGNNVAVLGSSVAQQLFQESVPLGHKFTFHGATFIVRGILSPFAAAPLSPAAMFNNAIFIPYQTAEGLTNNGTDFYSILAKPSNAKQTHTTITSVRDRLQIVHQGQQDFSVLDAQQSLQASSSVLDLLSKLIAGVAAVSLIVGGVGIMNVMLVSVTERMHEIGVRKAVGATNQQILQQFVLEAAVLSVAGAIVGVIFSLAIEFLLRTYSDFRPVVSWHALAWATLTSVVLGVVFGVAPAVKAARKDPIDALRRE